MFIVKHWAICLLSVLWHLSGKYKIKIPHRWDRVHIWLNRRKRFVTLAISSIHSFFHSIARKKARKDTIRRNWERKVPGNLRQNRTWAVASGIGPGKLSNEKKECLFLVTPSRCVLLSMLCVFHGQGNSHFFIQLVKSDSIANRTPPTITFQHAYCNRTGAAESHTHRRISNML